MTTSFSFQRAASVARKEVLHILRDRQTLFMTMFFPVVELMMLGYAIDTNVRFIPTVIFDQARTQESRSLLRQFENSDDFLIVGEIPSAAELTDQLETLGKEIFNLRFQRASGQLENTARVRQVRRDIARIKTIPGERSRTQSAVVAKAG